MPEERRVKMTKWEGQVNDENKHNLPALKRVIMLELCLNGRFSQLL
jgi:hypothetical protein